jgi:hypothetical protein
LNLQDNNECDTSWVNIGHYTSVGLSGLSYDTTYYWQVRALNDGGESSADGGAWRNSFGQGALAVYSLDGKNYGVPWDMGMVGWWYNKDLFTQAGVTQLPTTWAEFLAAVEALKAAGITPIALGEKIPGRVCTSGRTWRPVSAEKTVFLQPQIARDLSPIPALSKQVKSCRN